MIITKQYAKKLVRQGKAREVGKTSWGARWPDYPHFVIVERLEVGRTRPGDDQGVIRQARLAADVKKADIRPLLVLDNLPHALG